MSDTNRDTKDRTFADLVRDVAAELDLPDPSSEEIDFILWEKTAFPFARPRRIEEQVRDFMTSVR